MSAAAARTAADLTAPAGIRTPLVFLHGIGSTAEGWVEQQLRLPGHRTLAWNACGYGDNAPLRSEAPTVEAYADALAQDLDHSFDGPLVLVASSWGSLIALALAHAQPGRVDRLVLSGPTRGYGHLPPSERRSLWDARAERIRTLGVARMLQEDEARLLAAPPSSAQAGQLAHAREGVNAAGYLQALHALMAADGEALARGVRCPVLVVAGAQDRIAPPAAHAELLAGALHNARLECLPACGHLPHAEQAERFDQLLQAFIQPETSEDPT